MLKIAAVVLLYHPPEEVLSHIESYRKEVAHLYLVDNTEQESFSSVTEALMALPNISLIYRAENIGVAKAFNLALEHAQRDGYEWLLTMDQDSWFTAEELSRYKAHFISLEREGRIGLISPLHNPSFVSETGMDPYMERAAVLSSGNLVHVSHALEAGGYDEALFIDEVDHAFCFALQKHGYTVLQDRTVYLNHMLGKAFGTYGNIKLYPPVRLYYMLRNFLYLKERYEKDFPDFFQRRKSYLMKFFMKQLLFGRQRIETVRMLRRAYSDYRNSVYGRYHEK